MRAAKTAILPRIVIENVVPSVDAGRFAAKRVIGETFSIEADVFADGHEVLAVELLWRPADENGWRRVDMQLLNKDRWRAEFIPDRVGRYLFTIEAWWDRYGTFCRDLEVKHKAGADVRAEIVEGQQVVERVKARTQSVQGKIIAPALNWPVDAPTDLAVDILLAHDLREMMRDTEERLFLNRHEPPFAVDVERPQAAFGAWYELFPRSATDDPSRHGTFNDVIQRLPAIEDMGFDVLYLPPIHPIGVTNRKGKNNSLEVEPDDVGSPYAIGSSEGGHDAIHPALGTIEDFRRLRQAAAAHGMEIALDFAIQCSPAPGNIMPEIAKLNRIRKITPALQSHLGLRVYPAHHDQVLLCGKMPADRSEMVLIAVNLDPFQAHEVTIEVPLWEWNLPDGTSIGVRDLMRDAAFVWHGKLQRIRLDPAELSFPIWRIAPNAGG